MELCLEDYFREQQTFVSKSSSLEALVGRLSVVATNIAEKIDFDKAKVADRWKPAGINVHIVDMGLSQGRAHIGRHGEFNANLAVRITDRRTQDFVVAHECAHLLMMEDRYEPVWTKLDISVNDNEEVCDFFAELVTGKDVATVPTK